MDGKPLSLRRNNDDRDALRLFSYSSYDTYAEKSHAMRQGYEMSRGNSGLIRKRKGEFDDYSGVQY